MLLIRCDPNLPREVRRRVEPSLERAGRRWQGVAEAFVYCVPGPGEPRELIVRVSTAQGVVPILFRVQGLDASSIETALKGTLMRGDL